MREPLAGLMAAVALLAACAACDSDNTPEPIPDYLKESARAQSQCIRDDVGFAPTGVPWVFGSPTTVPYPTPGGGRVAPSFDVPVFPGATEIDGFELDRHNVQVFEAVATQEELFEFFEEEMLERDMVARGAGQGPTGRHCTFGPYYAPRILTGSEPIVQVTTNWVYREGEERGYRPGSPGGTLPFEGPDEGVLWYFVLTRR
ncbi:MAG: hypothetical protein WD557_14830 [Dehalococcoidia bacterium]